MIHRLSLILILALPAAAAAGTLCGQVVDRISGAPVVQAGVLVHQDDAYTGHHAATDASGQFCLELPAGTYRLEIRVDDYLTGWLEDVVVEDDLTEVRVPTAVPAVRLAAPWPNPTSGSAKVKVTVTRRTDVELSVHDARGRLLRRWAASGLDPGELDHVWDGLDHEGRPATDGLYLIRARADGHDVVRTLTLIR